ncbi:uncharacterized protein LOC127121112 [Lathyrus oleraceus]|nr:uncharacterized protein LOC127121112 [Pisum sativum]
MKFKPVIFMFFLCAIVLISVVAAIRPFKSGAIEESKRKGLGRGHSDEVDWVGSGTWGGWGGPREEEGGEGHEGGSEEGGNEESGWGGERHEGGSEQGGNEESGWGGERHEGGSEEGGNEGPEEEEEEEGGSVENGDR